MDSVYMPDGIWYNKCMEKVDGQKIKQAAKNLWIPLLVLVIMLGLDIVVKQLVVNNMTEGKNGSIAVIENFFYITSARNKGMAFGKLDDGSARWWFVAVTAVALPIVAYLWARWNSSHMTLRLALALVISGGIGNLIDRIATGQVVDMLDFRFGSLGEFPIFNIADSALVVGMVLLIVYLLFFYYDKKNPAEVAKHEHRAEMRLNKRLARQDARDLKTVESVDGYLARIAGEPSEKDKSLATEEGA